MKEKSQIHLTWELKGIKYALTMSKVESKKYLWRPTTFFSHTLNFQKAVQNHMFALSIQEALLLTSFQKC